VAGEFGLVGAQVRGVDDLIIAVDGPSGSGKSSTARGVASRLGLRYLDTGAMYRALTWAMLQRDVDVHDAEAVAAAATTVRIEAGTDPQHPTVTSDGVDVAVPIRGPAVTSAVSAVSAVPQVRALLVALQRQIIAAPGGIVVEGRDIGSVVVPQADVKVFLVAQAGARAERRTAQEGGSAEQVALTQADLARRDGLDSSRPVSPLFQPPDAVVVDTTPLTLSEVIDRVVALALAVESPLNPAAHDELPRTADMPSLPDWPMRVVRRVSAVALRARYDITCHHAEFVPRTGPVLFASNHVGYLDGPLLWSFAPRPLHAMIKREMYEGRMGTVLTVMGQIPLTRQRVDPRAVKLALRALREDKVVAIYPEGSRGPGDGRFAKPGLAYLAMCTGAPIVPVAVLGTRNPEERIDWMPPRGQRMAVVFGEPVLIDTSPWPRRQDEVRSATGELQRLLVDHIQDAVRLTGLGLPGPAPNQEGPEPGSTLLTERRPGGTVA